MTTGIPIETFDDSTPHIGSIIRTDGGTFYTLRWCEWEGAAFRVYLDHGPIKTLAVNVQVTGRTANKITGACGMWARANIVFVGDCELDVTVKGYLRLREW
jgi:hypothetical protein